MGRVKVLRNGMTPKQNGFVKELKKQLAKHGEINATEAAMQVYDVKSRAVAGALAAENLQKPIVKDSIEDALNSAGMSLDTISQNFARIANAIPDKITADSVLKANIEILKLRGDYPNKLNHGKGKVVQKVETLTYDEAKNEFTLFSKEATQFISDGELT